MKKHRYERIPFENTQLPIRINYDMFLDSQKVFCENSYSWHEQIELLYFREGEAYVYCGNRPVAVKSGEVVLINPYEAHQVVYKSGTPFYDCLMIDASLYYSKDNNEQENYFFDILTDKYIYFDNLIADDQELIGYIEALCREMREKAVAYELAIKCHVFGLLVCLLRRHIRSNLSCQQLSENVERYTRIKPALNFMKKNLSEHISLEELAEVCHLSSSHFCRLFHQITGVSPIRYLLDIRLQEAATLLKRTDENITQIAYEVGFEDVGYFSRKFKEFFGMSPTQAKKRYDE